ncbi:hypothetical protein FRUB_07307 [Fimbriiglobus ruber]|uniref:Uncharacterized protein n=1 Tax=Fimbriiglobus ruber TaxID=1908690 RepID=A0A225DPS9_9BACT|nr:hypothetical protein FRUB_07307 [Fimbriiglobus ruber]
MEGGTGSWAGAKSVRARFVDATAPGRHGIFGPVRSASKTMFFSTVSDSPDVSMDAYL